MVPEALIVAVEIGASNVDLLKMNIEANNLDDRIVPIHAGLWRESGEGRQKHSFTTRRFLETTDRWANHLVYEEPVRLLSIPDLLDEQEIPVAEYLNIQVNGAECEVLEGLQGAIDRIKIIAISAYYSKEGIRNVDRVCSFLEGHECEVLFRSAAGRVVAVTPKHREEVLARQSGAGGT